jgi:glycine/D-amino acid oxidase-like deaminating enzyme
MNHSFCSEDFKVQPYWWDQTPRSEAAGVLPDETEVLVVGAGYTGLHCALQTASAGRQTTVIDAEAAGWGCSTRNGGQISGEIKPDYDELSRQYGIDGAYDLIKEARNALDWLGEFVGAQNIDCDYQQCGRFVAAHSPRQFQKLVTFAQHQPAGLEQDLRIVAASDQSDEIDSDYYHGGLLIESHCSLDPAKYHAGLMRLAQQDGAQVISHCRATDIERNAAGFRVSTSRGTIQTRHLEIGRASCRERV